MKAEQVIAGGVAPTDGNISKTEAVAIAAFLANIEELGVRDMAIRVAQGSPSNGGMVKLSDVEGVIPPDYRLEYYVWLGGLKSANYVEDNNDETDPCYHNVRSIQKALTAGPKMANNLMFFINQFNCGLYLMTTEFAAAATDKALVEAWHAAHGTTEPVEEPGPADPPPVVPPIVVPQTSVVGEDDGDGQYAPLKGSEKYTVGQTVTEARGVFRKAEVPSPFGKPYTFWVKV